MKKLYAMLCILIVLSLHCSDSTGPDGSGGGTTLANDTIGVEGGSTGTEDIRLDIPAGAFSNDAAIALSTTSEQAFGDDAVSGTYTITGLPQSYGSDLAISVAYEGDLTDSSYIAVGTESWVSSLGEMVSTHTLLPAIVTDSTLTASLPATALAIGKPASTSEEVPVSVTVTAVTGYKPHVTSAGHFVIEYAPRWTTQASVQLLGEYLEEAYTTIAGLGFSYAGRNNWPVSVTVRDLGNEVYGFSTNSLWGDNYGYLEFNSKKMSEFTEIRTTAGHEFFHMIQSLYDPRNFYSKAKFQPPQHWLSEATAVWVEEKFSDQQGYVSEARAGNNMAPFEGVIAGAATDAGKHGYGMSAMVKYLVNEYGESCILKMYQEIKDGKTPLAAISSSTEDPVVWWDTFLQGYTHGDFYNVSLGELTANKSGMFQAIYDSDSLATFTDDYPDLSGRLYVIRLEHAAFDKNAIMNVSVTGEFSEISVFKYKLNPRSVELIGTNNSSVSVPDIRSLADDGWHLIALVSNYRNIPPYTQSTSITTTVRISKPTEVPPFNYVTLHPELVGDFESTLSDDYTSSFYPSLPPSGPGTLTGTTFSGSRNEYWNGGTVTGSYTITFDATFSNILSMEITQSYIKPGFTASDGTSYQNVTFSAHNIPLTYADGDVHYFKLNGTEITDQVDSMTFEYGIEGKQHTELVDYRSGPTSTILVTMMVLEL